MADANRSKLLLGIAVVILLAAAVSMGLNFAGKVEDPAAEEFQRAKAAARQEAAPVLRSGAVTDEASGNARLGAEAEVVPSETPNEDEQPASKGREPKKKRDRKRKPVETDEEDALDETSGRTKKPPMG